MFSTVRNLAGLTRNSGKSALGQLADFKVFVTIRVKAKARQFLSRFTRLNETCCISFYGYTVCGFDYPALDYLFSEIFVSEVYKFRSDVENPVIIDAGANLGMAALYFKKLYPAAKIMAFEPAPETFKLLRKNIETNQLKGIELFEAALSDTAGRIRFYSEDLGSINATAHKTTQTGIVNTVSAIRLSDQLKTFASVDLVKLDVEGSEVLVIQDLIKTGTLTKAKQYIIEYHGKLNQNVTLEEFVELFTANGFTCNYRSEPIISEARPNVLIHFVRK